MQKKYLVTGGLGFIGSALVNALSGDITIVARSTNHRERITNKRSSLLIKELDRVTEEDLAGCDVVYHLASTVHNYHVLTDPYIDIETNLKGTIALLEKCKNLPKKPLFVFASTFFVYGNEYERTKKPIDEESRTDPLGLYPATKLCAENVITLYSRLYGIPYLIARFTNVYGAGENFSDSKKAALNFLIVKILHGEDITLYDGGNFVRDYIYVDDVIRALMFLEHKAKNDLFLVGYGEPVSFRSIIDYALKETGSASKIQTVQAPEFHKAVGIKNFVADTDKINALGWRAQIGYTQGVRKIIEAYKEML